MESELSSLRAENGRLRAALATIAGEVGAAGSDLDACIAAIRRIKRPSLQFEKHSASSFRALFHITSRDNLLSIRQNGLTCALGQRSQADGFSVPMIHCFQDKLEVEEALFGWVLDVFGHDGGFLILEFDVSGPAMTGKHGPVLLEDVPFAAISVYDECFCPEDLTPVEDDNGRISLEEAVVWLEENGLSAWRDGSRLLVDIHDDNTVVAIVDERVDMSEILQAQRACEVRRQEYRSGWDLDHR